MIKRLQILSHALTNATFNHGAFEPIKVYIQNLYGFDYRDLLNGGKDTLSFLGEKIETYYKSLYKVKGTSVYELQGTIEEILGAIQQIVNTDDEELARQLQKLYPSPDNLGTKSSQGGGAVFIGHGRSKLWGQVQLMIQNELGLKTEIFENESRTGETIVPILGSFLDNSSFAVIIMTAEDETGDGKLRARQNVIHEVGLFQGRLGFQKVMILKQDGVEEFSNIAGLQYIPFSGDSIEQAFYPLQRALKKHGLIL